MKKHALLTLIFLYCIVIPYATLAAPEDFRVIAITSNGIRINAGSEAGVKQGITGTIYYLVAGQEVRIAKFSVTTVEVKSSVASIIEKTEEVKPDFLVIFDDELEQMAKIVSSETFKAKLSVEDSIKNMSLKESLDYARQLEDKGRLKDAASIYSALEQSGVNSLVFRDDQLRVSSKLNEQKAVALREAEQKRIVKELQDKLEENRLLVLRLLEKGDLEQAVRYQKMVCQADASEAEIIRLNNIQFKLECLKLPQKYYPDDISNIVQKFPELAGDLIAQANMNMAEKEKAEGDARDESERRMLTVCGHFFDNKDGTITDLSTGLMWMSRDSMQITGHGMKWKEAQVWVSSLKEGGYSDWRMPTVGELTYAIREYCSPLRPTSFGGDAAYFSNETGKNSSLRFYLNEFGKAVYDLIGSTDMSLFSRYRRVRAVRKAGTVDTRELVEKARKIGITSEKKDGKDLKSKSNAILSVVDVRILWPKRGILGFKGKNVGSTITGTLSLYPDHLAFESDQHTEDFYWSNIVNMKIVNPSTFYPQYCALKINPSSGPDIQFMFMPYTEGVKTRQENFCELLKNVMVTWQRNK